MQAQSLGWEDPLEEGMVTHSSIFCLENPHGQRSLLATVLTVAKSRTELKQLSMHTDKIMLYKSAGHKMFTTFIQHFELKEGVL